MASQKACKILKNMRLKISLFLVAIFFLLSAIVVYANPTYMNFYALHPFIIRQGLLGDIGRWFTWGIISGLSWIVNGVESAIFYLLTMGNPFFNSDFVTILMNYIHVVAVIFVPVVVIVIGIKVMTQGSQGMDYFKKVAKNVVFTILVVLGFNFLINTANNLMASGASYIIGTNDSLSLADELVSSSIVDLNHAYQFGASFNPNDLTHRNGLTAFEMAHLDYLQTANRSIFTHRIEMGATAPYFHELSDGRFPLIGVVDMFVGHVYRFVIISPFALIIQLLVMTVALLYSGIKFAKLTYDIAFKRLISTLIGIFDLHEGSKFKMLMSDIGNTFLMMFFVVLSFTLYIRFSLWLNSAAFPIFVNLLLLVGGSMGLIDGPKIVEKLTGHDAGMTSDGIRTMYFMSRMAGGAGRGVRNVARGTKNFAGGITEGLGDVGHNDNKTEANNFETGNLNDEANQSFNSGTAENANVTSGENVDVNNGKQTGGNSYDYQMFGALAKETESSDFGKNDFEKSSFDKNIFDKNTFENGELASSQGYNQSFNASRNSGNNQDFVSPDIKDGFPNTVPKAPPQTPKTLKSQGFGNTESYAYKAGKMVGTIAKNIHPTHEDSDYFIDSLTNQDLNFSTVPSTTEPTDNYADSVVLDEQQWVKNLIQTDNEME